MSPTLTAPDPAIFPADVLAFAAERGVTEYLVPLYELTRRCFPAAEVAVKQENDYEIAGLGWIVFEVAAYGTWPDEARRAARRRWLDELIKTTPPDARQPFSLALR